MNDHAIRDLVARVRARWRRLIALQAALRAFLTVSAVLATGLAVAHWVGRSPVSLAVAGVAVLVSVIAALAWGFWPAREKPSDARVARFIEEHEPSLDDRLVSAVDVGTTGREDVPLALAGAMLADASRRASAIDPRSVVASGHLRRAGFQAAAALALVAALGFGGRGTARASFDALSMSLFPARVQLEVTPGSVRVPAGTPLVVEARLAGTRAPVVGELLLTSEMASSAEPAWRASEMPTAPSGAFRADMGAVSASFRYRVRAGTIVSPVYEVTVLRPPRVTRIDLDYVFPKELGLSPRTEEDSGDVYAPSGTDVRLRVHTDRDVADGRLSLGSGRSVVLSRTSDGSLTASLTVLDDDSYRVALTDRDGLKSAGDTEYFIRTLEDRPPDVHVVRPARDRAVTRLEEVDIEARADDDFGVASMDLVYSVRGGAEKVVPFDIPARATTATGRRTLYLEDLNVQPGDFVSYYVRARDLSRGKRSSESRSDIFFLDVRPFDQEFRLAQSQGQGAGASGDRNIEDLIQAQKDVIVATWKLDRRSATAGGAQSADDVRAVGRAEADLKKRVEQTSSAFRGSALRDPRPRPQRGGAPAPAPPLRAGQTLAEEDDMTAAATAMGVAAASLDGLKTAAAMPPEMDALDHLLKAQADVKQHEVNQQQGGRGAVQNRSNVDLSNLFDKELQKQQRTNYETNTSAEQRQDDTSLLDKVRELAKRQDELNDRQKELARERAQMSAEELKRQLDQLTREQSDLRQKAEDLAQQMTQLQPSSQQSQSGQQGQQGQQNGTSASQSRETGRQSQGGQPNQSGSGQQGQSGAMRAASEAMRGATSDLRQQNPAQASESGARAADMLHQLERQLQARTPDERRRALGDAQLEARQLADAQRQMASELNRAGAQGAAGQDTLRRLAGEEERLAARAGRVQDSVKEQAGIAAGAAGDRNDQPGEQALVDASREFERQRVADRMKEASQDLRDAASGAQDRSGKPAQESVKDAAAAEAEAARSLDRLADRLSAAAAPRDAESQKLADTRARIEELRRQIDRVASELRQAGEQTNGRSNAQGGRGDSRGQSADGGGSGEIERLRQEYARQLQQASALIEQMKRDDPTLAQGGIGFTFEGQGMTLSAPGTEAFKQDFTKWDQLRQQATQALEKAETSIAKRLDANEAKERLASGVDDRPPAAYETQVNSYFKALAERKSR